MIFLVAIVRQRGLRPVMWRIRRRVALALTSALPARIWQANAARRHAAIDRRKPRRYAFPVAKRPLQQLLTAWTDGAVKETSRRAAVGSCDVLLAPPDWHSDPVTGMRFPLARAFQIQVVAPGEDRDARAVWEVSRLHQLTRFALATRLHLSSRTERAIVDLIRSWRDANPVGRGINWTVPMEAAIRAINMAAAVSLLGPECLPAEDLRMVERQLVVHGQFIRRNLELSDLCGNHLIADLLGAYWLGCYFAGTRYGDRLRRWAWRRLRRALLRGLAASGAPTEGSSTYHLLTMEMAYLALQLATQNGEHDLEPVRQRVHAAASFLSGYIDGRGQLVRIGDSDDGRVLRLWANASPIALIEAALREPAVRVPLDEPITADGLESLSEHALIGGQPAPGALMELTATPTSYDVRDGWLAARAGVISLWSRCDGSALRGRGHAHADITSLIIENHGRPLIVDPGHPRYGDARADRLRAISAGAHNGLVLDGMDYAPPLPFPIASIGDTPARMISHTATDATITFRAAHDGYPQWTVLRSVRLTAEAVSVEDRFHGCGPVSAQVRWTVAPEAMVRLVGGDGVVIARQGAADVRLRIRSCANFHLQLEDVTVYPTYGSAAVATSILVTVPELPHDTPIEMLVLLSGDTARHVGGVPTRR